MVLTIAKKHFVVFSFQRLMKLYETLKKLTLGTILKNTIKTKNSLKLMCILVYYNLYMFVINLISLFSYKVKKKK